MSQIRIRGLDDFRRELRRADSKMGNEVRTIHRRVADLVAGRAKAAAQAGGPQASRAASAIKPRATNTSAKIETVRKPPFALGVFWGQRKRSGWYANPRYSDAQGRQFDDWVGNQWDPGEHGGKPYFIGTAINSSLDEVEDIYLDGIDELARRAFPNH